jgi:hypothetical protein
MYIDKSQYEGLQQPVPTSQDAYRLRVSPELNHQCILRMWGVNFGLTRSVSVLRCGNYMVRDPILGHKRAPNQTRTHGQIRRRTPGFGGLLSPGGCSH